MQTKISYLSDLKFNLETWRRELRFHLSEMDTFEEKLEEIASREFVKKATIPLENFQNRIMLEREAISKLLHRIRNKMVNINNADFEESIDGRLQFEQAPLKEDMRNYIKLHYDLKEEMMNYFLEWL
jgi:hypothetical protein